MKLLLCYNPKSGKYRIKKNLDLIVSTLQTKYEVDIYETTGPRSLVEYLKNLDTEYDVVLLGGGDGTVNEGINGIMMSKYRPTIAIIPTGTTNDFCNNFGITRNIKKTLDIILEGNTKKHTIYSCGSEQYFDYVICAGMMTNITYQQKKKRLGTFSYWLRGMGAFFHAKKFKGTIKFDDEVVRTSDKKTSMVLITNSNHACGFKIKKYDKLGCVWIKGNRLFAIIQFGFFLMFHKAKHFYLCDKVEIESDLKEFNMDGEMGLPENGKIIIEPKGELTFFSKKKKK